MGKFRKIRNRIAHWIDRIQNRFEMKRKVRRLEVSRAGKGFLLLTISVGVVSLASGNNVLYLVESFLLSCLILSGILSERIVSAIQVDFFRIQARAGEPVSDWIMATNKSKKSLYCVEIGEWKKGKFIPLCFIPQIKGNETVRVKAERVIEKRGVFSWDGFAIATRYPFAFAKKIKVVRRPGERIVWPAKDSGVADQTAMPDSTSGSIRSEPDIVDGEIRTFDSNDDARLIVANQSIRGQGWMVRNRRAQSRDPEIILDARTDPSEEFERTVRRTARVFYDTDQASLILIQKNSRRTIKGSRNALTALALIQPEAMGVLEDVA